MSVSAQAEVQLNPLCACMAKLRHAHAAHQHTQCNLVHHNNKGRLQHRASHLPIANEEAEQQCFEHGVAKGHIGKNASTSPHDSVGLHGITSHTAPHPNSTASCTLPLGTPSACTSPGRCQEHRGAQPCAPQQPASSRCCQALVSHPHQPRWGSSAAAVSATACKVQWT